MNKSQATIGLAVVLSSITGTALAGGKAVVPVTVAGDGAFGSFGAARNSADNVQYISCSVTSGASVTDNATLTCVAVDSAGATRFCASNDWLYVQAAQSIVDGSLIAFNVDSAGRCRYLNIIASSLYEPPK